LAQHGSRRRADTPSQHAQYIIGVDLGGTNIVFGAMTVDGTQQFAMHSVPTMPELGADGVVARINEGIERVIAQTSAATGALVFHAGTAPGAGGLVTGGGRVLNVTALGDSVGEARERAYRAAEHIELAGVQYRRDIALGAVHANV